jgi:transposase
MALTQDFANLVRPRHGTQLETWRAQGAQRPLRAGRRFAQGLADDYDAVTAGLPWPWSTGPVERYMTRLKLLKRHRCGRANLALLPRRLVLAPGRGQGHGQRPQVRVQASSQPAAA